MAAVFGISELRSKLDDWRSNWKNPATEKPESADSSLEHYTLLDGKNAAHDLSVLLENLVIPKLIADQHDPHSRLDQKTLVPRSYGPSHPAITDQQVQQFTLLSVDGDAESMFEFLEQCLAKGSSVETLYVDLLAPAARLLGTFWEDEKADFVEVTMGLWRIQEVLRELTQRIPPLSVEGIGQRSALFSTMPGEQHSFGTIMVADCFERAGWDTDVLMEPSQSELLGRFANCRYDLIGLTISCDCATRQLADLVSAIRAVSSNPGICIMMGGRVINENPDLIDLCGADLTAKDAPSAVELANNMVPLNTDVFEQLT